MNDTGYYPTDYSKMCGNCGNTKHHRKDGCKFIHLTNNQIISILHGMEYAFREYRKITVSNHIYVEDVDKQPCPSCGDLNTEYNDSDLEDLRITEYILCSDCGHGT